MPLSGLLQIFMSQLDPEFILPPSLGGQVTQLSEDGESLEFGQRLGIKDSPEFEGLQIFAQFSVECDAFLNAGLTVQNDAIFQATVDACGALNVNDNLITLNNKDTPIDTNADGGGVVVLSDDDSGNKTFLWLNTFNAWVSNQDVLIEGGLELNATNKAFVLNRLTTVQRDGLTTEAGMVIYNTDTNAMEYHNGTVWVTIS